MRLRFKKALPLAAGALLALTACEDPNSGPVATQELDEDSGIISGNDGEPPLIEHEEFTAPQSISQFVSIIATITDDSDVLVANIYYKTQISTYFIPGAMSLQSPDEYIATIPSEDMGSAGMHYYIEAVDIHGNVGLLPQGAPTDYLKFDLVD